MPDKKEVIKKEITKLLAAGFITEIIHLEWLANPVPVKKNSAEWQMCVDYTNLNKHYPKDPLARNEATKVVCWLFFCLYSRK